MGLGSGERKAQPKMNHEQFSTKHYYYYYLWLPHKITGHFMQHTNINTTEKGTQDMNFKTNIFIFMLILLMGIAFYPNMSAANESYDYNKLTVTLEPYDDPQCKEIGTCQTRIFCGKNNEDVGKNRIAKIPIETLVVSVKFEVKAGDIINCKHYILNTVSKQKSGFSGLISLVIPQKIKDLAIPTYLELKIGN